MCYPETYCDGQVRPDVTKKLFERLDICPDFSNGVLHDLYYQRAFQLHSLVKNNEETTCVSVSPSSWQCNHVLK